MRAARVLQQYIGKSQHGHGEGSRGGHIIGHTKRGHAIYAEHDGAAGRALKLAPARSFHFEFPGVGFDAARDAHEAQHVKDVAAAGAHFPNWSIADHKQAARALRAHADSIRSYVGEPGHKEKSALYEVAGGHDTLADQFARHGHEIDGPHGPKIGVTPQGFDIHAHHSVAAGEAVPLHNGHEIGIEHVDPAEMHEGDFDDTLGTKMQLANGHALHFDTQLESEPYHRDATYEQPGEDEDAQFHTDVHVRDKDGRRLSGLTLSPQLRELAERHADRLDQEAQENYEPAEREYDKYDYDR